MPCPKSTIPYVCCLLLVSSSATTGVHVYFTHCMVQAQYVQELIKLTPDQGDNCPLVLACGTKDLKGLDHTRNPAMTTLLKWQNSNKFAKCRHSFHIKHWGEDDNLPAVSPVSNIICHHRCEVQICENVVIQPSHRSHRCRQQSRSS